jgi:hypothetical protein
MLPETTHSKRYYTKASTFYSPSPPPSFSWHLFDHLDYLRPEHLTSHRHRLLLLGCQQHCYIRARILKTIAPDDFTIFRSIAILLCTYVQVKFILFSRLTPHPIS